jgi:uncharacterized protein
VSLKDQITEDMKSAMRAKDSERLGTIRLLLAALKQKEIDERIVLEDAQTVAIVDKLIKQRRDSITAFDLAKRDDLAAKERSEIVVLSEYLPQQMTADEVSVAIQSAIAESGAKGAADMGKVMGVLKAKLAGRTDMSKVSGLVKTALSA